MPNKSSHAGHIAERSCVICRKKSDKSELLRFASVDGIQVFDLKNRIQGRGFYICNDSDCLQRLDRWIKKKRPWLIKKRLRTR